MHDFVRNLAFIGGGNMASAIIGALLRDGVQAHRITVIEPFAEAASQLQTATGLSVLPTADAHLQQADLVVWAVKPQVFKQAAGPVAPFTTGALHLSVAAGIRTDSIGTWLGTQRIVRAMPNTPALIGQGMTGLFACPQVSALDKAQIEHLVRCTGQHVWVSDEAHLDAVTALSGSGPAYVFFFLEAMTQAGVGMGLSQEQAYRLALATFQGASALAAASSEPAEVLRQRVTSKGGTTHAALSTLEDRDVKNAFVQAMQAAQQRAREMGEEFARG